MNIIKPLLIVFAVLAIFSISPAQSKEANQEFENKIRNLLNLSPDDTSRGWGKQKIDMVSRKGNFSDGGWIEYQNYVTFHKDRLRKIPGDQKTPWESIALFTDGSQKYTEGLNGLKEFSAEGVFFYGAFDTKISGDKFKIKISFIEGGATGASQNLIQKWNIAFDTPEQIPFRRSNGPAR